MKNSFKQKGFSLIELMSVLVIAAIIAAISVITFSSARKYNADDQSAKLTDIFDEARQSALNKRKTFRVEINKTKRQITLIDENVFDNVNDDEIVKISPLYPLVSVGEVPNNISAAPTASSPIPVLNFASSNYPLSQNEEKITLRFARSGRVLNTGNDNIGTNSIMTGATIYVYSKDEKNQKPEIIRAVTVMQTSGDTAILKCTFDTTGKCGNWKK